ncbi:hypothetical protein FKW77_003107 [Venturia effusa]|uniref:AAA+ ATPase domain-containing protein n=1 Tax=Venturia effusa TaxID=50376 RepID=A0A517LNL9_9PEZI|nr:hypothetical protein FKW77_003107 [Venturia effusa]
MSSSLMDLLSSAVRGGLEPDKLFELYIPGFTSMRQFFSTYFRIDLSKIMSIGFFCMLYMSAGRSMFGGVYDQFLGYFTSTISIPADDRVNREVLTYMSDHLARGSSRFLAVKTGDASISSPYGSEYVYKGDAEALQDALRASSDEKKKRINYFPAIGKSYFLFQGRPFIFDLIPRFGYTDNDFTPVPSGEEPIILRCLGRNPAPLKRFLQHCRDHSAKSRESVTTIFATQTERYGTGLEWREATMRPIRPLNTVDLDEKVKDNILADIRRYLLPATRLYYARRGVPYRRGFLFWGPPGTGKTSFSVALAGHFDLDIYMVSLASKNLDDDGLAKLFNALPSKCIVLMEDIDSAGINREKLKSKRSRGPKKEVESKTVDKAEEQESSTTPISLSGLLNVIDGAASQEGRILIMTSNTPETLDPALIRHGRIDKQIKFDYISKFDARQLFVRMFSMHEDEQAAADSPSDTSTPTEKLEMKITTEIDHVTRRENIARLALSFAEQIPEKKLSPAEVQGFLLDQRDDAEGAVERVAGWVLDIFAARALEVEEEKEKAREDGDFALDSDGEEGGDDVVAPMPRRPHSR